MSKSAKRIALISAAIATVAMLVATYFVAIRPIVLVVYPMLLSTTFDREVWLASGFDNEEEPCTRGRMVHDVMRRIERERPNRSAVVKLLGDGEIRPTYPSNSTPRACERYDLGLCAGPKMVRLNICFDEANRFERAQISYH